MLLALLSTALSVIVPLEKDRFHPKFGVLATQKVYCICEGGNCTNICPKEATWIRSNSSVLKNPKEHVNSTEILVFLLANFGNDPQWVPVLNLSKFGRNSVLVTPARLGERATVVLSPGFVESGRTWGFENVNVYCERGNYYFDSLETHGVKWHTFDKKDEVRISQAKLKTDFESHTGMPVNLQRLPSTAGLVVELNDSIADFVFLPEHVIMISVNSSSAVFDLTQIPSDEPAPEIRVSSRMFNISCFMPDMDEIADFPRITFYFERSLKVFLNIKQFPDSLMDLSERITMQHLSRTIFVETIEGVEPPTVKRIGTGKFYINKKIKTWFDSYCLCEGEDCEKLCGDKSIVEFGAIDKTVIGNPNTHLDYIIAESSAKNMPKFDMEHFGDRNITVKGATPGEHIAVFGRASVQDEGMHFVHGVSVHILKDKETEKYQVHFPVVEFTGVSFECKSDECVIKSNLLQIDYKSYVAAQERLTFEPGLLGTQIHTTNVVNLVNIELVSEYLIKVNDVKVRGCVETRSRITVKTGGNVNILLGAKLRDDPDVGKVPRLTIVTEGDINYVNFPGEQWPAKLNDITAKVIIVHGTNPLHICGAQTEKDKYATQPVIVAHEGTGPLYFNEVLSNYNNKYCVCEGEECKQACEHIGPIVSFNEKDISATATGNPSRSIEYVVLRSSSELRPIFSLDHFQVKSFLINGQKSRQYIVLHGTSNLCPPTSVSHCFRNVNIDFLFPAHFCFNNLDLREVSLVADKHFEPTELKINSRGVTADLMSLAVLTGADILAPCTHYMTVVGEDKLSRIFITGQADLRLEDAFKRYVVPVDLELLENPITILSTGATHDAPLTITWSIEDSAWFKTQIPVPQMRIDLSSIVADEAYVLFNGRKWEGDYHNISNRVSISYGQTDLHVEADKDSLEGYVGQPPHVKLDGLGDYYINGKKQATFTSPGNHSGDDDDDDDVFNIWGFLGIGLLIGAVIGAIVVMYVFRPRNPISQVPYSMTMTDHRRPEDELELTQFTVDTNVDDDEIEVQ